MYTQQRGWRGLNCVYVNIENIFTNIEQIKNEPTDVIKSEVQGREHHTSSLLT